MEFGKIDFLQVPICNYILIESDIIQFIYFFCMRTKFGCIAYRDLYH